MPEQPVPMKHDTAEKCSVATENTILRCQVGSGLHGVTVSNQDDRDEMGICIEPPHYVIGLASFDQYESRTQPMHVRSGPGDLDLTVYGLRKWASLAAAGNPTVLLPLFVPKSEIVCIEEPGHGLRAHRSIFLSRSAADRFIGYLDRQRARMIGELSQRTNRPELVAEYGFDTKFAYHAVRLGIQGVELMTTGNITLPMAEENRSWLLDIREGRVDKSEVMEAIDYYRDRLCRARTASSLPERVDYAVINAYLVELYQAWWGRQR